ncbi:hypothetical protein MVES_001414 [Malassezia vespertilionis]|uniref:Carboxylic ester hydrolase n=2 Tax=Malassezia vespertilionis TaxID=2020962 RepID=A0A2N1JDM6_9BASI|nr:hypothetical protein MVES_001414 [Malassezia vespertilionis]
MSLMNAKMAFALAVLLGLCVIAEFAMAQSQYANPMNHAMIRRASLRKNHNSHSSHLHSAQTHSSHSKSTHSSASSASKSARSKASHSASNSKSKHSVSHSKSKAASASSDASAAHSRSGEGDYLLIKTNEGLLRGFFNQTTQVYSWHGVPYADDTSGENRFLSPKPAKSWRGEKDASKRGPRCPQHGSFGSLSAISLFGLSSEIFDDSTQSEDCLNVDVWIGKNHWEKYKNSNGTSEKAPIWLNIYGGSYEWGASSIELYYGDAIVSQDDVVVVNINQRNWIFGYPMAPQLHPWRNSGDDYDGANPGHKDADLAIEWVYKNAEKFGGDPSRITIGGTSTGACTVDNWAYAHHNKPSAKYVNGMILQSGSMTSLGRYFLAEVSDDFTEPSSPWNKVAKHVGCGTETNKEQFKCMQQKRWQDVMQATSETDSKFLVTVDNKTAFNDYYDRLEAGSYVKAPMLIGNNKDEGNAFLVKAADLSLVAGPLITSEVWVCPASVQAKERIGKAPTWRYRFSADIYLPDTPKQYQQLLAFHGSDTAYAWGTWPPLRFIASDKTTNDTLPLVDYPPTTDNNKVRARISDLYREANVAFVKDPHNGLTNFHGGWSQYQPTTASVGDIGLRNSGQLHMATSADLDSLCPLTNKEVDQNNIKYKPKFSNIRGYIV